VAAFSPSCPFGGPRSVVAVCPVLAAATAARPSIWLGPYGALAIRHVITERPCYCNSSSPRLRK